MFENELDYYIIILANTLERWPTIKTNWRGALGSQDGKRENKIKEGGQTSRKTR